VDIICLCAVGANIRLAYQSVYQYSAYLCSHYRAESAFLLLFWETGQPLGKTNFK